MNRGSLPDKDAVRVEEFVNYFDYDYAPPVVDTFAAYVEGGPSPFAENRDLLLLVCEADESLLYYQQYLDILKRKAERLTVGQALQNVELVERMNRDLERNLFEGPVLGYGFCRLQ